MGEGRGGKQPAGARGSPPRQLPARPAPARRAALVEPWRLAIEPGLRVPLWAGGRAGSLEAASESAEAAPRRFVSPLLEPGERLLLWPAAGALGSSGSGGGRGIGSFFTPFLSSHSLTGCGGGGGNGGGKQIPPGATPRGARGRYLPPKHSPKSSPLGEDFRLLGEPCQASWDL